MRRGTCTHKALCPVREGLAWFGRTVIVLRFTLPRLCSVYDGLYSRDEGEERCQYSPGSIASQCRPVVAQCISICPARPHAHFPDRYTVRTIATQFALPAPQEAWLTLNCVIVPGVTGSFGGAVAFSTDILMPALAAPRLEMLGKQLGGRTAEFNDARSTSRP